MIKCCKDKALTPKDGIHKLNAAKYNRSFMSLAKMKARSNADTYFCYLNVTDERLMRPQFRSRDISSQAVIAASVHLCCLV